MKPRSQPEVTFSAKFRRLFAQKLRERMVTHEMDHYLLNRRNVRLRGRTVQRQGKERFQRFLVATRRRKSHLVVIDALLCAPAYQFLRLNPPGPWVNPFRCNSV